MCHDVRRSHFWKCRSREVRFVGSLRRIHLPWQRQLEHPPPHNKTPLPSLTHKKRSSNNIMHSWYRELPLPAEKYDDFPESSPMPVYDYSTLYHYEPPPEEPLRWFAEESPVARPVGQPHPQGLVVTKKPNAQARKVKVKSSTEDEAKPRRPLSAYNLCKSFCEVQSPLLRSRLSHNSLRCL